MHGECLRGTQFTCCLTRPAPRTRGHSHAGTKQGQTWRVHGPRTCSCIFRMKGQTLKSVKLALPRLQEPDGNSAQFCRTDHLQDSRSRLVERTQTCREPWGGERASGIHGEPLSPPMPGQDARCSVARDSVPTCLERRAKHFRDFKCNSVCSKGRAEENE